LSCGWETQLWMGNETPTFRFLPFHIVFILILLLHPPASPSSFFLHPSFSSSTADAYSNK